MKESIIKLLTDIVGTDYVLYDAEQIESYMYDQVEAVFRPKAAMTSVVVKPKSSAEISEIMKLASENVIPVVVRGGGTDFAGQLLRPMKA